MLNNTYICSSDNYFTKNVFESNVDHAYYAAVYFPGRVNEWGLDVDGYGRIVGIDHSPIDKWCMMGHVFFDAPFAMRFREILRDEYSDERTRGELWESVYERHLSELDMNVRKYDEGVILEFDALEDLRKFDHRYLEDSGSNVLKFICAQLHCKESDISNCEAIKNNLSHLAFRFVCRGKSYIYDHATKTIIGEKS